MGGGGGGRVVQRVGCCVGYRVPVWLISRSTCLDLVCCCGLCGAVQQNLVDNYTPNNDRCYIFPNCSTEPCRQSFPRTVVRWNKLDNTVHSGSRHSSRRWPKPNSSNFLFFAAHPHPLPQRQIPGCSNLQDRNREKYGVHAGGGDEAVVQVMAVTDTMWLQV